MVKIYKIGELSKIVDLPIETIRYYEKNNLFPKTDRGENGYRMFNEIHIEYLEFIKLCKEYGFSLKEITDILKTGLKYGFGDNYLKNKVLQKINDLDNQKRLIENQILSLEDLVPKLNKEKCDRLYKILNDVNNS